MVSELIDFIDLFVKERVVCGRIAWVVTEWYQSSRFEYLGAVGELIMLVEVIRVLGMDT